MIRFRHPFFFSEDEHGEDVRYYSTLDQFDALLSCLDERGPEKLLVYRLQKRYDDIARCMQITASKFHVQLRAKWFNSLALNDDDETDECRIPGQIDGVFDEMDEGDEERQTKPLVKKREFFVHSTHQNNGYPSVSDFLAMEMKRSIDLSLRNSMDIPTIRTRVPSRMAIIDSIHRNKLCGKIDCALNIVSIVKRVLLFDVCMTKTFIHRSGNDSNIIKRSIGIHRLIEAMLLAITRILERITIGIITLATTMKMKTAFSWTTNTMTSATISSNRKRIPMNSICHLGNTVRKWTCQR